MILYEDRDILVCRKKAGIPVQSAGVRQKDMVSILNNYLAKQEEGGVTVHVVHRLDQPVEGILVFAKTKRAAAGLSAQASGDAMRKKYLAVCCVMEKGRGFCDAEGKETVFHLTDYLVKDGKTNTSSVTQAQRRDAKKAALSFLVKKTRTEKFRENGQTALFALAEICLETGRHHQIRVQMSHAGLPLAGDRKYNPDWELYRTALPEFCLESGPALCAAELSFLHPSSGKRMKFWTEPENPAFLLFSETGSDCGAAPLFQPE